MSLLAPERTCTKCKTLKPFEDFPKNKNTRTGYNYVCHVCNRAKARAWQLANPERERARVKKWKAENAERVREQGRARRAADPERFNEASREWVRKNPEKRKDVVHRSYVKNRAKKADYSRRYAKANRARYRENLRQWKARNPAKVRAGNHARRRDPHDAHGVAYIDVLLHDPCSYCGATDQIWIDHITPVARGGKNEWENLTAACPTCNMSKNATPLLAWLAAR